MGFWLVDCVEETEDADALDWRIKWLEEDPAGRCRPRIRGKGITMWSRGGQTITKRGLPN